MITKEDFNKHWGHRCCLPSIEYARVRKLFEFADTYVGDHVIYVGQSLLEQLYWTIHHDERIRSLVDCWGYELHWICYGLSNGSGVYMTGDGEGVLAKDWDSACLLDHSIKGDISRSCDDVVFF